MTDEREQLDEQIRLLSSGQLALLNSIVTTFRQPIRLWHSDSSDVADARFVEAFGDTLRLHHTLSDDYLDKHRFEAAMCRVLRALGKECSRSSRNNPGHDITVENVAWSLKTQGDTQIKRDSLHISKFMELGKGRWENERDLADLRDRFLEHLKAYSRIFQLRYFGIRDDKQLREHFYELVEIPRKLLTESRKGTFEMRQESRQAPKPGYCTVRDRKQQIKFQLYFDGGTERKLQIKHLRNDLCFVHATWQFQDSSGPV